MKVILILILFIYSLSANDPTELKGKLKDVFDKPKVPLPKKKKTKSGKPVIFEEIIQKDLQAEIDQLVFKAFYTKDSIHRLMLEFENQILLLETNNEFKLKGEIYRLQSFDEHKAKIIHINTLKILTLTYRP